MSASPSSHERCHKYDELTVSGEFPLNFYHLATNCFYTSRIDYGIGLVRCGPIGAVPRSRLYYSCLIITEANRYGEVDAVRSQLLGCMACVRAHRQRMKRPDLDIFGIATDGYIYQFVNIDKLGTVHLSARWDISASYDNVKKVLWAIVFVLEKTFDMGPLLSPDQPGAQESTEALADHILAVDDTSYLAMKPELD